MPIPAAVIAAAQLAPIVLGAFHRKRKHTGLGKLNQEYQDYQPTGLLNPEDYAAAEATRNRLSSAVTATARGQRTLVHRRTLQRGTTGPAEEASFARVNQGEAAGREAAGMAANEQLYNVRLGRERAAQERAGRVYSTRVGSIYGGASRDATRQTAFMNSLLEYLPNLKNYFTRGGGVQDTNSNDPASPYFMGPLQPATSPLPTPAVPGRPV